MSKIFVDQVDPKTGTSLTLGTSGDTVNIPSGVTIANAGTATGFGVSLANGADNRVITASSATALNGEEFLTYNGTILGVGNDGNNADLGQGIHIKANDSGGAAATNEADFLIIEKNSDVGMQFLSATNGSANIYFGDSGNNKIGKIQYAHASDAMYFTTNASERLRITTGGNVGIADTAPAAALEVSPTSSEGVIYATGNSQANELIRWNNTNSTSTNHNISFFKRNGTTTGSISQTNNSTAFNTSSDYRIKENVNYNFDATARLKQLKPARFNFKTDVDKTVDGFIAHEVSDIIPEAITGTKDATETKTKVVLNASGNLIKDNIEQSDWIQGKTDGIYANNTTWEASKVFPVYQAIDQSRLVPLLVKTIQELEARITALENA